MPLISYCGNILEQEADAIVVPRLKHSSYLWPLSREIYDAADYYFMEKEYSDAFYDGGSYLVIEKDLCKFPFDEDEPRYHPNMVFTQGCDLKQHVCFHLEITDKYTDYNNPESYYFMRNCYMDALGVAFESNRKSIAFPLLGICMGLSVKEAREIAEDTINEWLRVKEKKHGPIDMKIYLVCDATDAGEKFDAFNSSGCFLEYEKQFQKKLSEAADPEYLMGSIVLDRIEEAGDSNLSSITGMDVTTINKIKNKQIGNLKKGKKRRCPHKDNVLILAVAMKLNDYERYEFIRCLKHDYPETEQDFQLEKILRSGVTEFRQVNTLLYGISPELALMPPDDVPEPVQNKERKSKPKNNQKKSNKDPEK